MLHVRRGASALLVLMLALSACGSDDDVSAGADTEIGQALTEEFMADGDSPFSSEEDARCMSGKIVDGIGEDRLEELGMTADNVPDIDAIDFTEGELDTVIDSLFDCVDVQAELAKEFESDFGEEGAQCVAENLDEDLVRDLMSASFVDAEPEMTDDFFQAFLDIAAECDLPLN